VTDEAMKAIGKMEKMEVLNLGSTKITDAGLAELKGLKNLRRVRVERTGVTEDGKKALREAVPKVQFGF
jgi:hypothetical protein